MDIASFVGFGLVWFDGLWLELYCTDCKSDLQSVHEST